MCLVRIIRIGLNGIFSCMMGDVDVGIAFYEVVTCVWDAVMWVTRIGDVNGW
jgi:hypothetical protein